MTPPPMLAPASIATAGVKDMSAQWRAFMGIDAEQRDTYATLADFARAPADEAFVYRCVTIRYQAAQSVPLKVYVRQGRNRIAVEDVEGGDAAGEDLQFLLDDANPVNMSGSDLKAYTEAALSVWGGSYWRKVRGRLGGPPQELYWLRTPDVTPKRGRLAPESYSMKLDGASSEAYAARDVVAFVRPNLVDQFAPLSPLSSIRHEIGTSVQASQRSESLLRNWSIPPGAWVAPREAPISKEDRSVIKRVLRAVRGPKNAGKVPVLPGGLTWQQMSLSPADSELLSTRKISRMMVCTALQVPLVLAGDDEKMGGAYRTTLDAERVFWRGMLTELDWYADVINSWLVPDFDPTRRRLVVGFDYEGIEALQAPLEDRKRVALDELKLKARTPNEYRAEFRTGTPVAWGDQPLLIANVVPQANEAVPSPPAGVTTDLPELTLDESASALRSVRGLYRQPEVQAFLAGEELDASALLGSPVDSTVRDHVAAGLRRRYSAEQIAGGVPAEGYPALT